jgi:hypothetical protein
MLFTEVCCKLRRDMSIGTAQPTDTWCCWCVLTSNFRWADQADVQGVDGEESGRCPLDIEYGVVYGDY